MSDRTRAIIGVLAVQGDFAAHQAALHSYGLATRQVRVPRHLDGIDGLVLPGGESTTMLKLLDLQGLTEPVLERIRADLPVLATCAGLILLAAEVIDPVQRGLGVLDIAVARNGYGRQIYSGSVALEMTPLEPATPQGEQPAGSALGVFIRAPRVLRTGIGVEVLARRGGDPVLLRQGKVLATCFHPELSKRHFVTEMFVQSVTRSE